MNDQMLAVWTKLQAFDVDGDGGGSALSFERRLARENNWSLTFAQRVIEEYKRFVLLARCAGHRVTPSDQVDQAWHLHLTYTRSYWDRLCGEVLGRPLHHDPTRGGTSEDAKFEDWYARTLESYRRIFEAEPPADIWPSGTERFDPELRFKRIDVADHYVVPKRRVWRVGLLGGAITMSTVFTGCAMAQSGSGNTAMVLGIGGIVLVLLLLLVVLIATLSRANPKPRPRRRVDTSSSGSEGFMYGTMMGMGTDGGSHHRDTTPTHGHLHDHGQGPHGATHDHSGSNSGDNWDSGSTDSGTGGDSGGGDSGSSGCGGGGCGGGGD